MLNVEMVQQTVLWIFKDALGSFLIATTKTWQISDMNVFVQLRLYEGGRETDAKIFEKRNSLFILLRWHRLSVLI